MTRKRWRVLRRSSARLSLATEFERDGIHLPEVERDKTRALRSQRQLETGGRNASAASSAVLVRDAALILQSIPEE